MTRVRNQKASDAFLALLILSFTLGAAAASAAPREATIAWKKIPDRMKYEIEVGKSADLDPVLHRQEVGLPRLTLKLEPGVYYFRLRSYDGAGVAGAWSGVEGFVVSPPPPKGFAPKRNAQLGPLKPGEHVDFQWQAGPKGSDYVIEVSDEQGVILTREVKTAKFRWEKPQPGKLEWRVGYRNLQGVEWGPVSKLRIQAPPEPEVEEKVSVSESLTQLRLGRFRVGGVAVSQSETEKSYSYALSWNPEWRFTDRYSLGASFGHSLLKGSGSGNFVTFDVLFVAGAEFSSLRIEALAGVSSWISRASHANVGATAAYLFKSSLDRVYVGWNRLSAQASGTSQILAAGVGWSL